MSLHRLDIIILIFEDFAIRRDFLVPSVDHCNFRSSKELSGELVEHHLHEPFTLRTYDKGKGIVLAVVVLVNEFAKPVLVASSRVGRRGREIGIVDRLYWYWREANIGIP
jgi:hypothetical protein